MQTQKKKKEFVLNRFMPYMGNKKALLPLSLVLSGISAALTIVPFVLIWYIVREVLATPHSIAVADISLYAWLSFGCAIAAVAIYFAALMSSHLAAFRVEVGMQKVGLAAIFTKPLGFFVTHPSGKIRKIVNDGAATTHSYLAHQLPDIAGTLVTPLVLLVLVFVVDWRMGLASLVPLVLSFLAMMYMMASVSEGFQNEYQNAMEEMSSESVEYMRGIPVVKTFGQSIFSFKRFYHSIIRYKDMVIKYTLQWQKPVSFFLVIIQTTAFFLIPVAILLINRGENLITVLADFVFYIVLAPNFAVILMKSINFQSQTLIAEQALDRLENLLDYAEMPLSQTPAAMNAATLEFKDVLFSYAGSDKPAINGVSFKLNKGETVALVGPSGGGKTTITRLAARFWDVDQGDVLIGGVNVRDIPKHELMDQIAFVFQSTKLFKGSLRENILLGKHEATEEEINQALDYSQSREIIENLEDGLDTIMGTKGTYLSGGEQQRIALARAIVKNASIVLLDEATAFADPENEHLIQRALQELSRGKTTLIIAHRLTSVQNADRILVIDDGKIVEQGNHDELVADNGIYKAMWDEYQKSVAWRIA
ncbi:MAG: ABC transporter ATP-binding protein [Chloroflexi bacterium]|nr:MAG: ABC transporter ATP-binding protein [Chloroflexota bacterium]